MPAIYFSCLETVSINTISRRFLKKHRLGRLYRISRKLANICYQITKDIKTARLVFWRKYSTNKDNIVRLIRFGGISYFNPLAELTNLLSRGRYAIYYFFLLLPRGPNKPVLSLTYVWPIPNIHLRDIATSLRKLIPPPYPFAM